MPTLENTRHEHFCQLVVKGASHRDAYRKSYAKPGSYLGSNGSKLMRTPHIRARVSELQEEAARDTVLSLQNMLRYLTSIVMAKPSEMDENSTICQSFKRTKDGIECKFPDKIRVLELLVKLQGLTRETPAQDTGPVGESGAYLPMSLLLEIQEQRRKVVEAQYARHNSPDNSSPNRTP